MHRSGTSAFTRVFSLLGCDLPKTLVPGHSSNVPGHWEPEPVYRLNDRILASANSSWHDWTQFDADWFQSPRAEEFREEALAVVQSEFGSSRLFVLKDPRVCRIAPFWLDVLKAAGARPVIVCPLRNPMEVAHSLERRNGFEVPMSHLLWLRHVLDAESASRGTPRFFASYDRLMTQWSRIATDAQAVLGIAWPRRCDDAAAEIDSFLSESHRHHHAAPEGVIDDPTLSPWLRETYRILDSWATEGENAHDLPRLDHIRAQFNAAAPAFSRLVAAGQSKARKVSELKRAARRLERQMAAARRRLEHKEQRISRLQGALESKDKAATEAERLVAALRDQLARAESAPGRPQQQAEQATAERTDACKQPRQPPGREKDREEPIASRSPSRG